MTSPSTVVATPASNMSMNVDDPSNLSPHATLESNWDPFAPPPGSPLPDNVAGPGYDNNWGGPLTQPALPDSSHVTAVASESRYEFASTQLVPGRAANEGVPENDAFPAAMGHITWSSGFAGMEDEVTYRGNMR